MSREPRLIEDVLRVLAEIRTLQAGPLAGEPIAELRKVATDRVTEQTGRVRTTVHDALTRRLGLTAGQFDGLAAEWLRGSSYRLLATLQGHQAGPADQERLRAFFDGASMPPVSPAAQSKRTVRRRRVSKPKPIAVVLDEDLAQVFRTPKAVNDALRGLLRVAQKAAKLPPQR